MTSTSIVLAVLCVLLASALVYSGRRHLATAQALRAACSENAIYRDRLQLLSKDLSLHQEARAVDAEQLGWAARWRPEWRRALLAQRFARNATGFGADDPQRAQLSASALALLLATSIEEVAEVIDPWVIACPEDRGIQRPTAESQAAETWRQIVAEARGLDELVTYVEEGQEQPPYEERLWRYLTGNSPVPHDRWSLSELAKARAQLLGRAQAAAVEIAANRGHPRGVAAPGLH